MKFSFLTAPRSLLYAPLSRISGVIGFSPVTSVAAGWRTGGHAIFHDGAVHTFGNEHPNDAIKHFRGEATYRMSFDLSGDHAKRPVRLQLGEVKHIAQVRMNGQDMGIVWTGPWSVALTGAIKAGGNEFEIHFVNTWGNRRHGDAALPMEKRITKTNIALQPARRKIQAFQGFSSEDPLVRSGLLGPVRLVFSLTGPVAGSSIPPS